MIHRFSEFAEIIGEGFLADHIVSSRDCSKAIEYANDIVKGRKIVHTGKATDLKCLQRYNRFLKWIVVTYGNQKCENTTQAQNFLNEKLNELLTCSGNWKSFYQWLRKETLRGASEIIYA